MHEKQGFTLLELLTTLVIVAIIIASARFGLRDRQGHRLLKQATSEVLDTAEHLALVAELRGQNQHIRFELTNNALWLLGPKGNQEPATTQHRKLYQLPPGLRIIRARFGNITHDPQTLTLRHDGSATPGTLIIENKHWQRCSIIQTLRGSRRSQCSF